jgi:hypothetical protein
MFNNNGNAILKGQRDTGTGLLHINLRSEKPQMQIPEDNNVYELRNAGSLVNYFSKACFSPTASALLKAVKIGHFVT